MNDLGILSGHRHKRRTPLRARRIGAAFAAGAAGLVAAPGDVPIEFFEPESARKRAKSWFGSLFLHGAVLALLMLLASLAPVIEDTIIPLALLRDEPDAPEPAPARKALAERRSMNYAPAVQAVAPQIVNPRVIAEASPAVEARTLDMDAVSSVAAPTQITRTSPVVVDRVSAVASIARARATQVDVASVGGPVVRGPVRANLPVGPSVGPRKVAAAASGSTMGTGKLSIGGGSSVAEGVLSTRDVLGSPDGAPLASVDTAVGEGLRAGPGGGDGTGTASAISCFGLPAVVSYLGSIQDRTLDRWALPPGVRADQQVTLKFRLDVAGSASRVALVRADDNALGASAIDALRAASPFPPLPEAARCLARVPITATFSNPGAS
jgi:TonB family protein